MSSGVHGSTSQKTAVLIFHINSVEKLVFCLPYRLHTVFFQCMRLMLHTHEMMNIDYYVVSLVYQ
jgi:hypothetical protein